MTKEEKLQIVKKYGASEKDSGKAEVQIALITKRINDLMNNPSTNVKVVDWIQENRGKVSDETIAAELKNRGLLF